MDKNDTVCWDDSGCFNPATAIFRKGGKEISVCDYHAPRYLKSSEFVRLTP